LFNIVPEKLLQLLANFVGVFNEISGQYTIKNNQTNETGPLNVIENKLIEGGTEKVFRANCSKR
jgi:hypothetical protein